MICPKCATVLTDFNWQEGGWCPSCEEWWDAQTIHELMEEIQDE